MKALFIVSLLAINSICLGQKAISGRVIDKETQAPLKGANIIVLGTTNGTVANEDGYFELDPGFKNSAARVSFVGYGSGDIKLTLKQSMLVELSRVVAMLPTINIGLGEYSGPGEYLEPKGQDGELQIEKELKGEGYVVVEEEARFYKGFDHLYTYFGANFQYPKSVMDNLSGTAFIEFTVQTDGVVSGVRFMKEGTPDEVAREFERLFASMPRWTPARQRGVAVEQKFVIPIRYAANK